MSKARRLRKANERQAAHWAKHVCTNCGQPGRHYCPPSCGDPGFFICLPVPADERTP